MALGIAALQAVLKSITGLTNKLELNNDEFLIQSKDYDSTNAAATTEVDEINKLDLEINNELIQRDQISKENPLNANFDVQEFIQNNKGMCGMGMGMGAFGEKTVKLSGAELIALSTILTESQEKGTATATDFDDIAKQLQSTGIDAKSVVTSDGKKTIEITHADKTKTVVFDANGNGGLDTQDYNFNAALSDFKKDLEVFNGKMTAISQKIKASEDARAPHLTNLKNLKIDMTQIDGKMKKLDENSKTLNTELESENKVYEVTEQTISKIAEQNAKQYAEDAERMTNTAKQDVKDAEELKKKLKDDKNKTTAEDYIKKMNEEVKIAEAQTKIAKDEAAKAATEAQAARKAQEATPKDDKLVSTHLDAAQKSEVAARTAKEQVIESLVKVYDYKQKIQELVTKEEEAAKK